MILLRKSQVIFLILLLFFNPRKGYIVPNITGGNVNTDTINTRNYVHFSRVIRDASSTGHNDQANNEVMNTKVNDIEVLTKVTNSGMPTNATDSQKNYSVNNANEKGGVTDLGIFINGIDEEPNTTVNYVERNRNLSNIGSDDTIGVFDNVTNENINASSVDIKTNFNITKTFTQLTTVPTHYKEIFESFKIDTRYWEHDRLIDVRNYFKNVTNSTLREMLELQMHSCPYSEFCNFSRLLNYGSRSPCGTCSCHNDCGVFGTCCIDSAHINDERKYLNRTCIASYFLSESYVKGESYYMIDSCPDYESNGTLKHLCQEAELDIVDRVPVLSSSSIHTTYKNKYCAYCHGQNDFHKFKMKLKCHDETILNTDTIEALISIVKEKREKCNILYLSPEDNPPDICYPDAISECNVHGYLDNYDKSLEKACHQYTMTYGSYVTYKNIFCFLCNEVDPYFRSTDLRFEIPHFTAILDFESHQDNILVTDATPCERFGVYDHYKNVCRPVTCSDVMYYDGKKCVPFQLYKHLKVFTSIFQRIEVTFDTITICNWCAFSHTHVIIGYFMSQFHDIITSKYRDQLENNQVCITDFYTDYGDYANHYAIIKNIRKTNRILIVQHLVIENWNVENLSEIAQMNLKLVQGFKYKLPPSLGFHLNYYIDNTAYKMFDNRIINYPVYLYPGVFYPLIAENTLRLDNLFVCPQVTISSTDYSFNQVDDRVCFEDNIQLCLGPTEYRFLSNNETLTMCKHTFETLILQKKSTDHQYTISISNSILSFTPNLCLLLCFGITLITY